MPLVRVACSVMVGSARRSGAPMVPVRPWAPLVRRAATAQGCAVTQSCAYRPAAAHAGRAAVVQGTITSADGSIPTLIGFPGVLVAVVIGVTVPAV